MFPGRFVGKYKARVLVKSESGRFQNDVEQLPVLLPLGIVNKAQYIVSNHIPRLSYSQAAGVR
jgi:hypothetical protein